MSADHRTTKYRFTQVGAVFALLVLVAVLAAATYAWFTNNTAVNTDSVSVHSDDSRLVIFNLLFNITRRPSSYWDFSFARNSDSFASPTDFGP